jgi:hypothetical protein
MLDGISFELRYESVKGLHYLIIETIYLDKVP